MEYANYNLDNYKEIGDIYWDPHPEYILQEGCPFQAIDLIYTHDWETDLYYHGTEDPYGYTEDDVYEKIFELGATVYCFGLEGPYRGTPVENEEPFKDFFSRRFEQCVFGSEDLFSIFNIDGQEKIVEYKTETVIAKVTKVSDIKLFNIHFIVLDFDHLELDQLVKKYHFDAIGCCNRKTPDTSCAHKIFRNIHAIVDENTVCFYRGLGDPRSSSVFVGHKNSKPMLALKDAIANDTFFQMNPINTVT